MRRINLFIGLAVIGLLLIRQAQAQESTPPIGVIQGAGDVSPYLNRFVNFRGVVIGRYEDENTRGDVYYTLFVQDISGQSDGDPATSDGIAVFLGRQPRADIVLGAQVRVGGKVTEFYGLTEIDDDGLIITIEEPTGPLPEPVLIDPPPDTAEQAAYLEALEGMRVAYDGPVVVAGPTHEGCGFAVIGEAHAAELPVIRRAGDEPTGRVVPVLFPSDKACEDIPQVKTGDRISGMAGALVYNFDQYKIIFDSAEQLTIEFAPLPALPALPAFGPQQIVLASINAEDYFDTVRDTSEEGEPVLSAEELAARQTKLAHAIAHVLGCPTVIGLQEVEHAALLAALSAGLVEDCGFAYEVSQPESPDARGIDNALLSDPRRVRIDDIALRQTCTPVPAAITDASVTCEAGTEPLFGRPPLQVAAHIDGRPYIFFVNHFKSKRGGEIETDLERVRQAVVLNSLAAELLASDPLAGIVALGDFNDTDLSPVLALLSDPGQGGVFVSALAAVPPAERYSYNFGGVVELIDEVLLSPALAQEASWATIMHTGTNYPVGWRFDTSPERRPYRTSDHDIPVVALGALPPTPEPEPTADDRPPTVEPLPTASTIPPTREPQPTIDVRPPTAQPRPTVDGRPIVEGPASSGLNRWTSLLIVIALVGLVGFVGFRIRR
ncbi:MAG: hypothetical protein KA586_03055 [Candidatus Promineofilum sp.]|nr:hypothetical protein [Promineifilum sp.]